MRSDKFKGSKNITAKLSEDEVRFIKRSILIEGETVSSIAKMFGVCTATISLIKSGKNWSHIIDF